MYNSIPHMTFFVGYPSCRRPCHPKGSALGAREGGRGLSAVSVSGLFLTVHPHEAYRGSPAGSAVGFKWAQTSWSRPVEAPRRLDTSCGPPRRLALRPGRQDSPLAYAGPGKHPPVASHLRAVLALRRTIPSRHTRRSDVYFKLSVKTLS